MYKVGIISEVHGTIPLIIPLCLENSSPVPEPLLLTWNPSFALWCNSCPLWSLVACILTSSPLLSSPSPFPFPQRFPISNMCPPTTTLRHWLHIFRYNNITGLNIAVLSIKTTQLRIRPDVKKITKVWKHSTLKDTQFWQSQCRIWTSNEPTSKVQYGWGGNTRSPLPSFLKVSH